MMTSETKRCAKCQLDKAIADFPKGSKAQGGVYPYCRPCHALRSKTWTCDNPEKAGGIRRRQSDRKAAWRQEFPGRARDLDRIRRYGVSGTAYQDMMGAQDHRCAICQTDAPGGAGGWHVDHCHDTGVIRGGLCAGCNLSLGRLKDSPETFASCLVYLAAHGKAMTTDQLADFMAVYAPLVHDPTH